MKRFWIVVLFAVILFAVISKAKAEAGEAGFVCKGKVAIPSVKTAPKKSLALGSSQDLLRRDPDTFILGELKVLCYTVGFTGEDNPDLSAEDLENVIFSGQYSLANYICEVS